MSSVQATVSRWFLPLLGVLSGGVTLAFVGIAPNNTVLVSLLEGALALILAAILFVVGYQYFTTTDLPEAEARIVALGTVGGFGLLAVMNIWFRLLGVVLGEVQPQFAAMTSLTAGTLGGAVVGITIAQSRRRYTEREEALSDYEELFQTAQDGIFIDDPETGTILEVNERAAEMLGYTSNELEGMSIGAISADDPSFDQEAAMEKLQQVIAGEPQQFDWLLERNDGSTLWAEVALKQTTIGGQQRLIAFVRDISDRKQYERELERAEKRFRSLAENTSFGVITIDETSTIQYVNDAIEELLGYTPEELTGDSLTTIMPERFRSQHEAGITRYLNEGTRNLDWDGIELVGLHKDGTEIPLEVSFGELVVGADCLFTGVLRDISERKRQERQIAALHDATREMVQSTDKQTVCEIVIQTAESVLELPVTGIWLTDDSGDRLEPVAITDTAQELFGEHPTYTEGNSLSWKAFSTGEPIIFDDLKENQSAYNPETDVRSELIIPLGEYGVLNTGAIEPNAFSDNEIELTKLLAANTRVALEHVEHERDLERQTDQMEFFNSILRHDVLNGITVIRSRAEFLADELDGEQLQDAETIVTWSNDIVEIVQRVRTVLETLTNETDTQLEPVDLASSLRTEIERVRATYPEVTLEMTVPEDVVVLANELLGDVLGNVITNAVDHNDTNGLHVSVSVEKADDIVTVRVRDNGQGVSDDRKETVFRRGETGHAKSTGSGFGLFFVDSMMDEYGGDVWVTDNDSDGATFVLQFQAVC